MSRARGRPPAAATQLLRTLCPALPTSTILTSCLLTDLLTSDLASAPDSSSRKPYVLHMQSR